jgi:hypothetical protein
MRIPFQHPAVPVAPSGTSRPPSRLLVIPDFHPEVSVTVDIPPACAGASVPTARGEDGARATESTAIPDRQLPARSADLLTDLEATIPVIGTGSELNSVTPTADADPASSPTTDPRWSVRAAERVKSLAAATEQVRRLVETLPKRSTLGWQRTILFIAGGAMLAYGVAGGWQRDSTKPPSKSTRKVADREASAESEVHRMTRAPLRVEPVNSTVSTASPDATDGNSNDPIFQIPHTRSHNDSDRTDEVGSGEVRPAARTGAAEPARELPLISAPNGSAVSRHVDRISDPPLIHPARTETPADAIAWQKDAARSGGAGHARGNQNAFSRKTLSETRSRDDRVPETRPPATHEAPAPSSHYHYPHTDPSKYRDPEYVVPVIANRGQETAR